MWGWVMFFERRRTLLLSVLEPAPALGWLLVLTIIWMPSTGHAGVLHTKQEALALAFPGAERVESKTLFLTEAQAAEIQSLAKARQESRLIRYYVGWTGDEVLGYAFIDTHVVRTKTETFMVVLSADGSVLESRVLAFHEPPEYMPPQRWLDQFQGQPLSPELNVRRKIAGIAGATMSAHALTAGVRRVMACYRVGLLGDARNKSTAMLAQ